MFPFESPLPPRCYPIQEGEDYVLYQMDFPDGRGRMTCYSVLPGIYLTFNEFYTHFGFQTENRLPGCVEINHCLRGRFECTLPNGRRVHVGPQDFSINDLAYPPCDSAFSLGEYYGIGLVLQVDTANRSVNTLLGREQLHLTPVLDRLLGEGHLLILRADPKIQHIFSELYLAPAQVRMSYYRLKVSELLLFLEFQQLQQTGVPARYISRDLTQRLRQMERQMTQDLRVHLPLEQLALQYQMSETTLKKNFQKVFGESPYAYLRRRRMEAAALLLQTTQKSIGEIAQEVGYQNPSKFSQAFSALYGVSPSEYKKGVLLE